MKQKFFTLLLGLAMVSVNALAQEPVSVSISKLYGATTYVCNQDLDFSTVATSMRPYYIEDYGTSTGNFSLKAFTDAKVPANTPMILIGKQYPQAGKSEVVMCDVPVATSIDNAAQVRKDVFTKAGGHAWLMPVINGSYVCSNFNAENAEGTDDEKVYNMTFYNYSAGTSRTVPQTEDVNFGQEKYTQNELTYVKEYFPQYDITDNTIIPTIINNTYDNWTNATTKASGKGIMAWNVFAGVTTAISGVQVNNVSNGDYCIFTYPAHNEETIFGTIPSPREAGLFLLNSNMWHFQQSLSEIPSNSIYGYDPDEDKWIKNIEPGIVSTEQYRDNPNRTVYNYVLSVNNSGNPVFKLCNATTGTTVPYGKCYVSVWSNVKAGASSREDIGIEFVEDEEDLGQIDDEVSGIKNVNVTKEANGIYNINGQKLVKLQKGLNIVNGKKVYVK